jgi:lipopolysaccharide transport system permease protein
MFLEIIKYRDLLWMLVLRDIRIRYKQAAMGFMWSIFMPIVAMLAGIIVQKAISMVSGRPMEIKALVSVSIKVLPWTFFINAIKFAVQSLVGNRELITKIYFPREILPLASIIACLFDFIIAGSALTIFLVIAGIGFSKYLVLLPMLLLLLLAFTTGLGLFLATANLFFRDVKYVVEIILMFGVFFTPVFYSASTFGKWKFILMLNPLGSILEAFNSVVVMHQMPEASWFLYGGIMSAVTLVAGIYIFNKLEFLFAENI